MARLLTILKLDETCVERRKSSEEFDSNFMHCVQGNSEPCH